MPDAEGVTLQVLLYADDLLIVVTGEPENAVSIFLLVWGSVRAFSRYSGLHVNYKKSAVFLNPLMMGDSCKPPM